MDSVNILREVLSMEVDDSPTVESIYRIRLGNQIKYLVVEGGTYDVEILEFPPYFLEHLPELPLGEWTQAHVSRQSGNISINLSFDKLPAACNHWHPTTVEFLSLSFEADCSSPRVQIVTSGSKSVVAKFAQFPHEVQYIDPETAIYQAIDGYHIGPAFLGHVTEQGRIMGFLIELVEGRRAGPSDLEACQNIVKCLHLLGIVHGDLNRHNFIISPSGAVTLIDFENAKIEGTQEEMEKEYNELSQQLAEETGRGGMIVQ